MKLIKIIIASSLLLPLSGCYTILCRVFTDYGSGGCN
jgi:hypothetical protein